MEIRVDECPFCNGTEFIRGKQENYAVVNGEGLHSSSLNHIICRKCGSVVRSYVDNPEKLLNKKNRKN